MRFIFTLAACLLAQSAHAQTYDFTNRPAAGAIAVQRHTLPRYDAAAGYGFVDQTNALPARAVHTDTIRREAAGYIITESSIDPESGKDHYNNYGMAFRIKAPPGAYAIRVRTTSEAADTTVSIGGMQTSRLLTPVFWDAASLLPNKTPMTAQGREWTYRYVNGRDTIDIEVEPKKAGVPVGLSAITLTPIAPQQRPAGVLPAIYTLGDSTVKSYTFDEAPMSGWGQVFAQLFDPAKVRVVNYSMGGRSFRNAYAEGRLNDLLLTVNAGDLLLIQFGHNDESPDERRRYGRGATEAMYEEMIRKVYLPAIRARGVLPVFVTPMSRVNGMQERGQPYVDSFDKRRFPALMKKLGAELGVPVVDLNARSVDYYNATGHAAITAMVMSIEAGETPGKTNDGSYANGHPANKIDGTHFKESLSKQYARMVAAGLTEVVPEIAPLLRRDWAAMPEIAADIVDGDNAYYRNQIEKLLQLGALSTDAQGLFHPQAIMQSAEFAVALAKVMGLQPGVAPADGPLTREEMGALLIDAYQARYAAKPTYMTDYNGRTILPGSPGYDPNLDSSAQGAMYYPLLRWTQLRDTAAVSPSYAAKLRQAYELGLIRAEAGIARGRMVNGSLLEPRAQVTRAKAAKALYFMWVLAQAPKHENHQLPSR